MKQFILLLSLVILSFSQLNAQICQIPNGDFETWEDASDFIETAEPLPADSVLLPEGYFSLFRLFFSIIGDVFETLVGEELEEFALMAFGVMRSEDASSGDYAVQMGGDEYGAFTDLIAAFECSGSVPDSFYIDVKHVGIGVDTFYAQGSFGVDSEIPFDVDELEETAGYFTLEFISDTDTEYQTLAVPVINNNNGIEIDSALIVFVVTGDEQFFTNGGESHFVFDNLRFENNSSVLAHEQVSIEGNFEETHNSLSFTLDLSDPVQSTTLQRSMSAEGSFEDLSSVDISTAPIYKDYNIQSHTTYYYRLETVLANGKELHSDILSLQTREVKEMLDLYIYPNPWTDNSLIRITSDIDITHPIGEVIDLTGRRVAELEMPDYIKSGQSSISISDLGLPSGMYTIQIAGDQTNKVVPLVIR